LLIVLATASDTVADETLRELGLDPNRLAEIAQTARRSRAADDPSARIEKARQNKEAALESKDLDRAARFRDEERRLTLELRSKHAAAVEAIRDRLGLVERHSDD
jgi:hypothetical protein